ncbi:MAG: hypothetical protein QF745_08915, partial [Planctomycetota bacterium]|nr:hypothetical protein [Planctomycetota bacterium]
FYFPARGKDQETFKRKKPPCGQAGQNRKTSPQTIQILIWVSRCTWPICSLRSSEGSGVLFILG